MDVKEQLEALEPKKAVAIGAVLVVVYYFLLFDDGSRLEAQIIEAQNQISVQETKLASVNRAFQDQKRFSKEIKEISSHMKSFLEYFPTKSDPNDFQKAITLAAEVVGAEIVTIKPGKTQTEFPDYPEIAFEFTIEGTYHQIMKFISELTQLKRAIDFRNLVFKVSRNNTEENLKIQFSTTLIVYGHIDNPKGAAGG